MKPRFLLGFALLVTCSALPSPVRAQDVPVVPARASTGDGKWVVDMLHSQVGFAVRHLVGRVRGSFDRWYAVITTKDGDWKTGTATVTVETGSLDTGNRFRDADLRSDRFFASDRYPRMTFEGTGFAVSDSTLDLNGILTIRGKSKPVTLTGRYRGAVKGADGKERIGFEATGTVDRRDFDISWNETVGGTDLIGNDVEITVGIEAVRVN
jgi:polyisoprenoid-binding protein YceI